MKKWLTLLAMTAGLVSTGNAADINRLKTFTGVASQWPWQLNTDGTWTSKQPAFSDISGVASANQIPAPTTSTIGGVKSSSAPTSQFMTGIDAAGVATYAQPAFSDISGVASADQIPVANNNTQLTALPATISVAVRLGYATAGDAPAVTYTRNNSACTLNGGTGDGGSQVPARDGGCWNAITGQEFNVLNFGADPTGAADSTAAINATITAANATFGKSKVIFPSGTFRVSGTGIALNTNNTALVCSGATATKIVQTNLSGSVITNSGLNNELHGCQLDYSGTPSGGSALLSIGSNFTADSFRINSAYIGIEVSSATTPNAAHMFTNFQVTSYAIIGMKAKNTNDIYVSNCIFNAQTSSNGALGGFRYEDKSEAINVINCSVLNGVYGITTDASSYTMNNRPAYNRFTNVFFDTNTLGSVLDKAVEFEFVGGWFSGGRSGGGYPGMTLLGVNTIKFIGTEFFNNGSQGLALVGGANTSNVQCTSCTFESNSVTAGVGVASGIYVGADVSNWSVTGGNAGNGLYTGQQGYGVYVASGASDYYSISNILCSNNTVSCVSDNGSGAHKSITYPGLAAPAPVTKTANYTVDSGTGKDSSIIFNGAGSLTLTLPAASSWPGRVIRVKTIAAQTVVSAASDVVPLVGGAASTAILAATAGKWLDLQSDGSNWIGMAGN